MTGRDRWTAQAEDQRLEAPFGHAGTRLLEWAIPTAALGECFLEHGADLGKQEAVDGASRKLPRGRLGMQTRSPQCLVRVDIAHARDRRLAEEDALDRRVLPRECGTEAPVVEGRIERVAGDVRHLGRNGGGIRPPAPSCVAMSPSIVIVRASARKHGIAERDGVEAAMWPVLTIALDDENPQREMRRIRYERPPSRNPHPQVG